jgi:hypothetical protein
MSIMSNTLLPASLGPSSTIPDRGETGGGRPPTEGASHQIRPPPLSAQIFKIPDEGDPVLQRFILEKISFHIAVFPYFSLPDQETH